MCMDPSKNLKTIPVARSEDYKLSEIVSSFVNASVHTGARSTVELLNSEYYSHSHHHHKHALEGIGYASWLCSKLYESRQEGCKPIVQFLLSILPEQG